MHTGSGSVVTVLAVFICTLIASASPARAQPRFDTTVEVARTEPSSMFFGGTRLASGDFNGDSIDDLVAFDIFESFIAFGSPDGRFVQRTALEAPFYFDGYFVVVKDADGDSDLDIVLSNLGPDFTVPEFYINDGAGQMERIKPPALIGVGNAQLIDVNADGFEDVVGIDLFGSIQILLATGHLEYEKFPLFLDGYTALSDAGYVDEDEYPDLLSGDKLLLLRRDPSRTIVVPLPFAADALIDINGDSSAEVISLLPDAAYVRPATMRTYKIHDNKPFLIQTLVVPVTANARVTPADLDDDGDIDLLLSSAPRWQDGTGTFTTPIPCDVTILYNTGDSMFALGPTIATEGLYTTSVAIGQFDGKHTKDIVAANSGIGLVANGTTDRRTFGNSIRAMFASEGHPLTSPAQLIAKSLTPSPIFDPVCVDLDNDGFLDFAALSTGTLQVRMGLGDGTFCDTPVYVETVTIGSIQSLGVVDIDHDQHNELVTYFANNSIGGQIVVVPEPPPGTPGQFYPGVRARSVNLPDDLPLPRPNRAVVADLDGDFDDDYAGYTSNSAATPSSTLRVRVNTDGVFAPPVATVLPGGFQSMAAVDVNDDHASDLVVYKRVGPPSGDCGCFVDWRVDLLLNDGHAAFTSTVNLLQIADPITGLVVEDLDADGRKDVLITSRDRRVRVLRGVPGGFAAPEIKDISPFLIPSQPAVGDFDRDGDLDIASTVEDVSLGYVTPSFNLSDRSLFLMNNSRAQFPNSHLLVHHPAITGPASAIDIDDDSVPDYVVGNSLTGVTLFRNSTPPPPVCTGDINDDQIVDGRDLAVLLSRYGNPPRPADPADLNDDGVIDGRDLAILLAQFGHKCRP